MFRILSISTIVLLIIFGVIAHNPLVISYFFPLNRSVEFLHSTIQYQGRIVDGRPDGEGSYTHPSGESYEGGWKKGIKHGHGVWVRSTGEKYAGGFKEGLFSDQGTLTYSDGGIYVGRWQSGVSQGEGSYTHLNGET